MVDWTLQPEQAITSAAGIISLLLAAWVLLLNVHHRSHRALALVLLLQGAFSSVAVFRGSGMPGDPLRDWRAYLEVALPFAALYLVYVMRFRPVRFETRKPPLPHPLIPAGLLAVPCLVGVLLISGDNHFPQADGTAVLFGLLYFISPVGYLLVAVASLLLFRDALGATSRSTRLSLLFLAIGIGMSKVFLAGIYAYVVGRSAVRDPSFPAAPHLAPYLWIELAMNLFTVGMVGWLGVSAWRRTSRHDLAVASVARRYTGAWAIAVASVVVVAGLQMWGGDLVVVAARLVHGLWVLALPVLTSYALVRMRLFGADLGMRWVISRGTLSGVFLAVFFATGQVAEDVFGSLFGIVTGGILTGLLLFALHPLERFAHRAGRTALPEARPVEELSSPERMEIYREQAILAWADGALRKKERLLLDRLRDRLGLDVGRCAQIERDAYMRLGLPRGTEGGRGRGRASV